MYSLLQLRTLKKKLSRRKDGTLAIHTKIPVFPYQITPLKKGLKATTLTSTPTPSARGNSKTTTLFTTYPEKDFHHHFKTPNKILEPLSYHQPTYIYLWNQNFCTVCNHPHSSSIPCTKINQISSKKEVTAENQQLPETNASAKPKTENPTSKNKNQKIVQKDTSTDKKHQKTKKDNSRNMTPSKTRKENHQSKKIEEEPIPIYGTRVTHMQRNNAIIENKEN